MKKLTRTEIDQSANLASANEFQASIRVYIDRYISLADRKAAFFFSVLVAALAYLDTRGATLIWLRELSSWSFKSLLVAVADLGLVTGAVGALLTLVPRLAGVVEGVVFWEAIARFNSSKEYAKRILETEHHALVQENLHHCHELAQICSRKYRMLKMAIWCGAVGLTAFIGYLIV